MGQRKTAEMWCPKKFRVDLLCGGHRAPHHLKPLIELPPIDQRQPPVEARPGKICPQILIHAVVERLVEEMAAAQRIGPNEFA